MSTPALETIVYSRMLSFCNKGLNHPSRDIKFLFLNAVQNSGSPFSNNIKTICHKLGITKEEVHGLSSSDIKTSLKCLDNNNNVPAEICLIKELIDIKDGLLCCNLNYHELNCCLAALCTK